MSKNFVQMKSIIFGYIIKPISTLMMITGIILFSIVPVFADGDGNIYMIDEHKYLYWVYWIQHLTNDFQIYQLDNSSLDLNMERSDVNVYTLQATCTESNLQSTKDNITNSGGTVTASAYWMTDNYGQRLYKVNYQIPLIDNFNTTSGNEQNYIQNIYMYPHIHGTYTCKTSYNTSDTNYLFNQEYMIAFWTNKSVSKIYLYGADGTTNTFNSTVSQSISQGMFKRLVYFKFTPNKSQLYTISFTDINNSTNMDVLPVYWGLYNLMPDDVAYTLNRHTFSENLIDSINTKVGEIKDSISTLVNGNSKSTTAENNLKNKTNTFSAASDQVETTDTLAKNNFNSSMNNISTNIDLNNNTNFLSAMNWVSTQYTNIVSNNPIQYILMFSLVLGIALTIIGKVRNR